MSEAPATTTEQDGAIVCPYCQDNVPMLIPVEAGMKLRLQNEAQIASPPDQVCNGCFKILSKMISKGAVLRQEQQVKEKNRLTLWRNRVQLVKQAKLQLAQKNFPDAAVAYEKYLRVLEVVYEAKPGGLTPELFKNEARGQEITVIASVYWDLMRIYDTNSRYADRQLKAADKLAEFVRFTPIFPHIMRKAESQARSAKNPEAFRRFLKVASSKRPRCFIATAAFDGERTETVAALCAFRDQKLKKSAAGRAFVLGYYRISPEIAAFLDKHPSLKPATRKALKWLAHSSFIRNRLNP